MPPAKQVDFYSIGLMTSETRPAFNRQISGYHGWVELSSFTVLRGKILYPVIPGPKVA